MTILSASTLRTMISPFEQDNYHPHLIAPVDYENYNWIEGSGYDMHLDAVYARKGFDVPILGIDVRRTTQLQALCCKPADLSCFDLILHDLEPEKRQELGNIWHLPYGLYQLRMVEHVSIPPGYMGFVLRRVSWGLSGAVVFGSRIPPGYDGIIRVTLAVLDPIGVVVEHGTKAITTVFSDMDQIDPSACDCYSKDGNWANEKMESEGVIPGS